MFLGGSWPEGEGPAAVGLSTLLAGASGGGAGVSLRTGAGTAGAVACPGARAGAPDSGVEVAGTGVGGTRGLWPSG